MPCTAPALSRQEANGGKSSTSLAPLSLRGQDHASKVTPFWNTFDQMLQDAYSSSNPNGFVNMAIANNSLMEPELVDFYRKAMAESFQPVDLTYGTSLFGSTRLFDALCKHYSTSTFSPITPILPEHIITGPGCGSLLDQIFIHLAEENEGVLVAAPEYNGFTADCETRAKVKCLPVYDPAGGDGAQDSDFNESALRGFEEELVKQEANGTKVRAVILCNPHNPTGRVYTRAALLEYGRFVEKHDLHLVVDEIYALSVFRADGEQEFISAHNIDWQGEAGCNPSRVHVLSSASKDFGSNGLRVGTLVSQHNPELIKAMKMTAKLYMVSSPSDAIFSALLDHPTFYDAYIRTNKARLMQAYELACAFFEHHGITYTPASAGHFVLADLTRFMPRVAGGKELSLDEQETALWARALDHRVSITPGSNYHCPKKGTFRLTFSLRRPAMLEGLRRLELALGLAPWTPPAEQPEAALGLTEEEIDAPLREAATMPPAPIITHDRTVSTNRELSPGANAVITALCGMSAPPTPAKTVPRKHALDEDESANYERLVRLRDMTQNAPCAC